MAQQLWGASHVKLIDGKRLNSLFPLRDGLDLSLCGFAPGFRAYWTVVGFLAHTKTFHDFFAFFITPAMAPITTFMVGYGHLLIGLSLLTGLFVRVTRFLAYC